MVNIVRQVGAAYWRIVKWRLGNTALAAEVARAQQGTCRCLCDLHAGYGTVCRTAGATVRVRLTDGGDGQEASVRMCVPCAGWWRSVHPRRVLGVTFS